MIIEYCKYPMVYVCKVHCWIYVWSSPADPFHAFPTCKLVMPKPAKTVLCCHDARVLCHSRCMCPGLKPRVWHIIYPTEHQAPGQWPFHELALATASSLTALLGCGYVSQVVLPPPPLSATKPVPTSSPEVYPTQNTSSQRLVTTGTTGSHLLLFPQHPLGNAEAGLPCMLQLRLEGRALGRQGQCC